MITGTFSSSSINFGGTVMNHITGDGDEFFLAKLALALPPVANFLASDTSFCVGTCIDFTDQSINDPTTWNWVFQGAAPGTSSVQNPKTICYDSAGTFQVQLIVTNTNGTDTLVKNIKVNPLPVADAGVDATIFAGDSIQLSATGGPAYTWFPGSDLSDTTIASPWAKPDSTTTFYLTILDGNGCADSDTVTVFVQDKPIVDSIVCGDVYIPHGFSPNGDGQNDTLYVRGNCIVTLSLVVFDRWGEKVFETSEVTKGWDGKFNGADMDPAVYVYYLHTTSQKGVEVNEKGNIVLVK